MHVLGKKCDCLMVFVSNHNGRTNTINVHSNLTKQWREILQERVTETKGDVHKERLWNIYSDICAYRLPLYFCYQELHRMTLQIYNENVTQFKS